MSLFSVDRENGTTSTEGGSGPPEQINIVGRGTRIEGTVDTEHNIRIGGTLDGDLKSGGKIMIAEGGRVEGEVRAKAADVAGEVDGEITVEGLLVLRSSAVIRGDLTTEKLVIEDGAVFTGHCTMSSGGSASGAESRSGENVGRDEDEGAERSGRSETLEESSSSAR
jgi:cytoskeletal protein CcmA (bactofilin family)